MPANSILLNGLYGDVLSVYTEPEYRGQGLCTKLMNNLVAYGKEKGLGKIVRASYTADAGKGLRLSEMCNNAS